MTAVRSRRAGISAEEAAQRPMYARVLGLQYLRPSSLVSFVFFEGSIALAALLALAELAQWWVVAVLPLSIAAMVKLNDIIAGAAIPSGGSYVARESHARARATVRLHPNRVRRAAGASFRPRSGGAPSGGALSGGAADRALSGGAGNRALSGGAPSGGAAAGRVRDARGGPGHQVAGEVGGGRPVPAAWPGTPAVPVSSPAWEAESRAWEEAEADNRALAADSAIREAGGIGGTASAGSPGGPSAADTRDGGWSPAWADGPTAELATGATAGQSGATPTPAPTPDQPHEPAFFGGSEARPDQPISPDRPPEPGSWPPPRVSDAPGELSAAAGPLAEPPGPSSYGPHTSAPVPSSLSDSLVLGAARTSVEPPPSESDSLVLGAPTATEPVALWSSQSELSQGDSSPAGDGGGGWGPSSEAASNVESARPVSPGGRLGSPEQRARQSGARRYQ